MKTSLRRSLSFRSYSALGVMALAVISGYMLVRVHASGLLGDVNSDGMVNITDLSLVLAGWDKTGATDINGDGKTDIYDLSVLLSHWGQTAATPAPSAGATPTPAPATPTPAPTTVPSTSLNLPRIPWEGGPAYWSKFPTAVAAGWTNPSFFPISVFLGKPSQAAALKNVGVNTYMGAEHDGSPVSMMTGEGMYVIAQTEWTRTEIGNDKNVVGWFVSDECDIGLGCTTGTATGDLQQQTGWVNEIKAYNDGRFTQANYSNGILDEWWAIGTMSGLMSVVDVASDDKYAYTSPFVDNQLVASGWWPTGAKPASSGAYGWLVDRMRAYQTPAGVHPNWVFVEAAMPLLNDAGSLTITPNQIEGAEWSAIIHEARGIAFFQHNNGPVCGYYSLVDCDATRLAQIKAINAQIQSLAPVINTQSYVYNFNSGTDTMLKTYNGSAYIFADLGLNQTTGSKKFTLPPGITGTTVTVVGEGRTLPVTNGTFTDSFAAEYSHHTYQIAL